MCLLINPDRDEERDAEVEEDEEEQPYTRAKDQDLTWKTGQNIFPLSPSGKWVFLKPQRSKHQLTTSETWHKVLSYMAIFNFPKTRLYWSTAARVDCIANTMSVNHWETILQWRFLHFNINEDQIPASQPGHDGLFKVHPLLTALKRSFNIVPMHEILYIDEQIVPFKGKSSLKQYNPKK